MKSVKSIRRKRKAPLSSSSSSQKRQQQQQQQKRKSVQEPSRGSQPSGLNDDSQWSKSKKKRMRRVKAKQKKQQLEPNDTVVAAQQQKSPKKKKQSFNEEKSLLSVPTRAVLPTAKPAPHSKLQQRFQEQLSGSNFRLLNEQLYTTSSQQSFAKFQTNPKLFDVYHQGFCQQVKDWPMNPVQVIVETIQRQQQQQQSKNNNQPLVVADFGCGHAELARTLLQSNNNNNNNNKQTRTKTQPLYICHSFDMVARGPNAHLITPCDVCHKIPLSKNSVDIGVFCLSLMSTNWLNALQGAHSVLKPHAKCHIAEVKSRFFDSKPQKQQCKTKDTNNNNNTTTTQSWQTFLDALHQLGFDVTRVDTTSNKMFVLLELQQNPNRRPQITISHKTTLTAKPCLYKRR